MFLYGPFRALFWGAGPKADLLSARASGGSKILAILKGQVSYLYYRIQQESLKEALEAHEKWALNGGDVGACVVVSRLVF